MPKKPRRDPIQFKGNRFDRVYNKGDTPDTVGFKLRKDLVENELAKGKTEEDIARMEAEAGWREAETKKQNRGVVVEVGPSILKKESTLTEEATRSNIDVARRKGRKNQEAARLVAKEEALAAAQFAEEIINQNRTNEQATTSTRDGVSGARQRGQTSLRANGDAISNLPIPPTGSNGTSKQRYTDLSANGEAIWNLPIPPIESDGISEQRQGFVRSKATWDLNGANAGNRVNENTRQNPQKTVAKVAKSKEVQGIIKNLSSGVSSVFGFANKGSQGAAKNRDTAVANNGPRYEQVRVNNSKKISNGGGGLGGPGS